MPDPLSKNDLDFLNTAVTCVTQFTYEFAETVWGISPVASKRRLAKLEQRGLLHSRTVLASTPPPVKQPLCVWRPGGPLPDCGQASYRARKRWKTLPVVVKRVFYATDLGRALLGRGPVQPPKDVQATHDLGVTAMYLEFRRRWPTLTKRCWLNESEYSHLRGRCVKVEDAMLRRPGGEVLLMVDYAGAYRPDRVEALIRHAQEHSVPIVIA